MFKKVFIFSFFLISFFLADKPKAYAQESIKEFTSNIIIDKNSQIQVLETIVYDFDQNQRRGIYREIPIIYQNDQGKKFKIDLQFTSVTDEKGNKYNYTVSQKGDDKVIKIGKEDKYLSGVHTYIIAYQLLGVITYFSDHDELYWNATGNNWNVPIEKAQAFVHLDFSNPNSLKTICYTGEIKSQEKDCIIQADDSQNASFASNYILPPGEGLTFAVSFPKDLVAVVEPEIYISFWETIFGKIILFFISFYYLIAPIIMFVIWYLYGRDPKVAKPVRAWYDPPKDKDGNFLKPAEVGTLVDEYVDDRDITATIVDLAIKGFLKIKETKKGREYSFTKLKDYSQEKLTVFEKKILDGFFLKKKTITTQELKKDFHKTAEEVKQELYKLLVNKDFFPKDPKKTRQTYYIIAAIIAFTGNLLLAITMVIFGRIMPKKTIFGATKQNVALGLKSFLSSQERQIEFQSKNWYLFEKLLPFAIVFKVEKIWAKRFQDLSVTAPSWYESSYPQKFNSFVFVNSLSRATSSMTTIATPVKSSSGFSSGFSGGGGGGGFGGGGGGSW